MIFNTEYKLLHDMGELTQEQIFRTPEFFAMSWEEVVKHPQCPDHLRAVLTGMAWNGKPNFVQVRPQDFRHGIPHVLGRGWHSDLNTHLVTGKEHRAKDMNEFRSMVVSFGNVVETEFARGPLDIDTNAHNPFDHVGFANYVESLRPATVKLAPNQLASYTSKDIHRVAPDIKIGRMRLIIVTVEMDNALERGAGEVRKSISER